MNTTFKNQAAQGDLLIRRIDTLPEGVKEIQSKDGKHIVAHSETGHHHFIKKAEARFYGTDDPMVCYLQVEEGAILTHDRSFDTHAPLFIPSGTFELRRQREHTPAGWRRIED